MRTPRYSARSAIRSSNKSRIENALTLPAPSSDTHPWSGMRKRKYREKHIAAYGAALLGDHTSPECAIASMGAVAWLSSDDLSCHSFINGSDTSDLQGHENQEAKDYRRQRGCMTPCTSCCVRTYGTEKRAGRTRNRSSQIARVAPTSKQRLTNKYVAFAAVLNAMRLRATRMMSCSKSGHVCK